MKETPAACYYFGCWDRPGHYLFGSDRDGMMRYLDGVGPFTDGLDSKYTEKTPTYQDESFSWLVHRDGWTLMAMWDRSCDTRGACNCCFIVPETGLCREEMWRRALANFPMVTARLLARRPDIAKAIGQP